MPNKLRQQNETTIKKINVEKKTHTFKIIESFSFILDSEVLITDGYTILLNSERKWRCMITNRKSFNPPAVVPIPPPINAKPINTSEK